MRLHTTAEVISFAKELESKSANLYKEMAEKHVSDQDLLLSLCRDNERNVKDIERAYYGVISDAIEGCFAFDMMTDEYEIETIVTQDTDYPALLRRAVEIEENIIKFYSEAASQSDGLMADVPRAFRMVAKRRANRESRLKSLLGKEAG